MTAALALAQIGIQLLPTLTTGVEEMIGFISKVRAAARQTQQWTADQDTAFRTSLTMAGKDPAYLLDGK